MKRKNDIRIEYLDGLVITNIKFSLVPHRNFFKAYYEDELVKAGIYAVASTRDKAITKLEEIRKLKRGQVSSVKFNF